MKFSLTSSTREVEDMLNDLEDLSRDVMKPAFKFYKKETPVRSGNARNQTKLKGQTINSDYAYAGRLDEGWSKQAPDGMTKPTIEEIDNLVDKEVRKIGR